MAAKATRAPPPAKVAPLDTAVYRSRASEGYAEKKAEGQLRNAQKTVLSLDARDDKGVRPRNQLALVAAVRSLTLAFRSRRRSSPSSISRRQTPLLFRRRSWTPFRSSLQTSSQRRTTTRRRRSASSPRWRRMPLRLLLQEASETRTTRTRSADKLVWMASRCFERRLGRGPQTHGLWTTVSRAGRRRRLTPKTGCCSPSRPESCSSFR